MFRTLSAIFLALLLSIGCSERKRITVGTSTPRDVASFDRAIDSMKAIAQSQPSNCEILNRLGLLHYQKAKWMYEMMKYRVDFQMRRVRGSIEAVADEATRIFDEIVRAKPDRAESYKNKALVSLLKNEWEQDEEQYMRNSRDALALLHRADSLQPQSSEIWYWKGFTYSRFHRRLGEREAEQCFERAMKLDTANAKAAIALSDLDFASGMSADRVVELYASVSRSETQDAELLRGKGDLYRYMVWRARDGILASLGSNPVFMKPIVILGLGIFLKRSKEVEVREDIVEHGIATADDYWSLAQLYSNAGNTRKTVEVFKNLLNVSNYTVATASHWGGDILDRFSFEDAAKLEPSLAWIQFYHGKNGWGQGPAVEDVRSVLLKAIELDPGLTLAYYMVGVWYFEHKDYDNAITWLKLAIDRKPTDEFAAFTAHQLLLLIYLNKGEVKKAIEEYKNAMKIDSSFASRSFHHRLFGRRGGIAFLPERPIASNVVLGRDDKKIASMLDALGSWGTEPRGVWPYSSYYQNAPTEFIFNSNQEEFLKSAVELDPDNEEAYLRLATYYEFSVQHRWAVDEKVGEARDFPVSQLDEAIKVLKTFLNRHPESRAAHFQLGQYYTQSRLYAKAVEEYKTAARLGSALALEELERMGQVR
jgi:tetratricopeptide (TPR) repeat protein